MRYKEVFRAWGRILQGEQPCLSVEITTKCPLTCPGCYACQSEHVSGVPLVSLADKDGDTLVDGMVELVERHRPLLLHIIGGEPLVRYRELTALPPRYAQAV